MHYDFGYKLQQGQEGEAALDEYLSDNYHVFPVNRALQRLGIDRVLVNRDTGKPFTVEIKTDEVAQRTGNAFIETISVDDSEGLTPKQGWAYTSKAEFLLYYTLPSTCYVLRLSELRQRLPIWETRYQKRWAQNDGYRTHGLLVPMNQIQKLALKTFEVNQ